MHWEKLKYLNQLRPNTLFLVWIADKDRQVGHGLREFCRMFPHVRPFHVFPENVHKLLFLEHPDSNNVVLFCENTTKAEVLYNIVSDDLDALDFTTIMMHNLAWGASWLYFSHKSVEKYFKFEISTGMNPFCLIYRCPTETEIPFLLLFTFTKRNVQCAMILDKSQPAYYQVKAQNFVSEPISADLEFGQLLAWFERQRDLFHAEIDSRPLPSVRTKFDSKKLYCIEWRRPRMHVLPAGLKEFLHEYPNFGIYYVESDKNNFVLVDQNKNVYGPEMSTSATHAEMFQWVGACVRAWEAVHFKVNYLS
jgi:hypothetical protein